MKYIYIDHNIFIETLDNEEINIFLNEAKNNENVKFLYSPAHIEEIYKVASDVNSKNSSKMNKLLENISEITNNNEVLPTLDGIIIKKESPLECYKRVKGIDTTNRVKLDSAKRYEQDNNSYKKLILDNKRNVAISTIEFNKIWENQIVKDKIDMLNKNISEEIKRYNNSIDVLTHMLMGIDRRLSQNFCFRKGNYEILKSSFNELEYTIEILFRILNNCGYNADKSEWTSISGTHDVTHGIYATKADYLISTDLRFVKKCKAVYYYLGIKTEVIHVKENEIIKTLNSIIYNK